MQKAISMLSEVKESIINAYEIKSGMSRAKLARLMDEETWMDARKAVELGFADEILKRDTADLNDEPAMTDTLYSPARVTNSLMDKIAAKCRIEGKQVTEDKVKADTLIARLDLLKNWR